MGLRPGKGIRFSRGVTLTEESELQGSHAQKAFEPTEESKPAGESKPTGESKLTGESKPTGIQILCRTLKSPGRRTHEIL